MTPRFCKTKPTRCIGGEYVNNGVADTTLSSMRSRFTPCISRLNYRFLFSEFLILFGLISTFSFPWPVKSALAREVLGP
jgi:hypothetical protein